MTTMGFPFDSLRNAAQHESPGSGQRAHMPQAELKGLRTAYIHDSPQHRAIALGMVAVKPVRGFRKAAQDDDSLLRSRATHGPKEP